MIANLDGSAEVVSFTFGGGFARMVSMRYTLEVEGH